LSAERRWFGRSTPQGQPASDEVLVIGLGRFGSALAIELERLGHPVLGVDRDPGLVQRYANDLSQTLVADTTSEEALRQIGAPEFAQVVVGIGGDIEASILTCLALVELGVPKIWAKAITRPHEKILQRIGVHKVVLPEAEMGTRVAHLVTNRLIDYIELHGMALVEARVPASLVGQTLSGAEIRKRFGVSVVYIGPEGGGWEIATPNRVMQSNDVLLVAGEPKLAEHFGLLE
jgi:trk system potassium uptake protein TrkA